MRSNFLRRVCGCIHWVKKMEYFRISGPSNLAFGRFWRGQPKSFEIVTKKRHRIRPESTCIHWVEKMENCRFSPPKMRSFGRGARRLTKPIFLKHLGRLRIACQNECIHRVKLFWGRLPDYYLCLRFCWWKMRRYRNQIVLKIRKPVNL